jgi:hypothetical protein
MITKKISTVEKRECETPDMRTRNDDRLDLVVPWAGIVMDVMRCEKLKRAKMLTVPPIRFSSAHPLFFLLVSLPRCARSAR